MPTYEYACTGCQRHFEVWQSFQDDALETCEECQGKLRRVFHPVGVLFKGSGFYSTDARSAASRKGSESKPSSEKETGSAAGAKTDASSSESSGSESKSAPKGGEGSAAKASSPKTSDSDSGTGGKEKSA